MALSGQSADDAAGREPHGPGFARVVYVLAGALVFYVLSIGPMCKLSDRGMVSDRFMQVAYAPIIFGVQASPPVHAFFDWYLKTVWKSRC